MEFVSQGSSGGGFYIGTNGANGQFRAGDNWQVTGVAVPVGQWAHVALTYTSGTTTAVLYVNGVPMGTNSAYSLTAGASNFALGQQFGGFGEFLTGSTDQLRVWNVALTQAQVKQTMYGTVSPSAAGLVADYEMNEGSGSVMGNATATTGLDGTLASNPNNPAWVNSPVQFGNNALNFDGSATRVVAPSNSAFEISSGTIEAAINPTTLSPSTNMEIVGYRSGAGTRYSFHVSSTAVGIYNNSTFVTWPVTIPTNTWTYLSWVSDGTNVTLYVNGTSQGSVVAPFSSLTGLAFDIGFTNNGGPGVDAEFFQGSIDEVRVWNVQLTGAQIGLSMGQTLHGNETGLVALYSFDQGNPGNDNTGLTNAVDNTINTNNATLSNFALTGSTSNFIGSPITLPVTLTSFTATRSGSHALLSWQTAQEENSHDFSIEHSTNGTSFSAIGDVAAAGNSNKSTDYSFVDENPATGLNYYRLKETDLDGHSTYSQVRTVAFATSSAQKLAWYITNGTNVEVSLTNGSNEFYNLSAMDGHIVQKGQFSAGKLYLSGLQSGIYVVNVTTFTGQQLVTKVFVP
jgi:hypothetical protein